MIEAIEVCQLCFGVKLSVSLAFEDHNFLVFKRLVLGHMSLKTTLDDIFDIRPIPHMS